MNVTRSDLPESDRCGAATRLTTTEAATLSVVSGDAPPAEARLSCEIAAGHDGRHSAFATLSERDDRWWWLCWDGEVREVRPVDLCSGRDDDDPYLDECLLLEGHPGPHSYSIHPAVGS